MAKITDKVSKTRKLIITKILHPLFPKTVFDPKTRQYIYVDLENAALYQELEAIIGSYCGNNGHASGLLGIVNDQKIKNYSQVLTRYQNALEAVKKQFVRQEEEKVVAHLDEAINYLSEALSLSRANDSGDFVNKTRKAILDEILLFDFHKMADSHQPGRWYLGHEREAEYRALELLVGAPRGYKNKQASGLLRFFSEHEIPAADFRAHIKALIKIQAEFSKAEQIDCKRSVAALLNDPIVNLIKAFGLLLVNIPLNIYEKTKDGFLKQVERYQINLVDLFGAKDVLVWAKHNPSWARRIIRSQWDSLSLANIIEIIEHYNSKALVHLKGKACKGNEFVRELVEEIIVRNENLLNKFFRQGQAENNSDVNLVGLLGEAIILNWALLNSVFASEILNSQGLHLSADSIVTILEHFSKQQEIKRYSEFFKGSGENFTIVLMEKYIFSKPEVLNKLLSPLELNKTMRYGPLYRKLCLYIGENGANIKTVSISRP